MGARLIMVDGAIRDADQHDGAPERFARRGCSREPPTPLTMWPWVRARTALSGNGVVTEFRAASIPRLRTSASLASLMEVQMPQAPLGGPVGPRLRGRRLCSVVRDLCLTARGT